MVEGHPKTHRRLTRSISTGSSGMIISPNNSARVTSITATTPRSTSVYSTLSLHLINSTPSSQVTTPNFVVPNPITTTTSTKRPSSPMSSSTSPPLLIQSGRKETRSILYQGIYQKFNRVFSAVNAFKMQKVKGSSVSGEYSRVATTTTTTEGTATSSPSTSLQNFQT